MRSIWTGTISFGLVSVPVKVYGATDDHDISLHQVHDKDGGRIRYQRRCEVCEQIVEYADIDKAYDDGEHTVVLTAEELASLPAESAKEIEVVQFVPAEQIDPLQHDRAYYLQSDGKSPKAYALLTRTLDSTELVAVVKFALRQKTRLGLLTTRDGVLVLQSLLWPDEVREPHFDPVTAKVSAQELKMSKALLETYQGDFDPEDFTDEYQVELQALIEAKLEKGDAVDTAVTHGEGDDDEGGEVIDLMAALKSSLAAKRGEEPEDGADDGGADDGGADDTSDQDGAASPVKKTPAKKAPEKTPAKKAPAKKAPAKSSTSKSSTTGKAPAKKSSGTRSRKSA